MLGIKEHRETQPVQVYVQDAYTSQRLRRLLGNSEQVNVRQC